MPAVQLQNKTMNAETAEHVGTPQLKQFHMVNTKMWYHPKYYKELRKRNKSDQVISKRTCDGESERAPGQGLKLGEMDIASSKQQATSQTKTSLSSESLKHQATSVKS